MKANTAEKIWDAEHFEPLNFACPCKSCVGHLPDRFFDKALKLAKTLDIVRRIIGVPIYVVSALRCPAHNRELEGQSLSRHIFGEAADIQTREYTGCELRGMFEVLIRLRHIPNGGLATFKDRPEILHYDQRQDPVRWAE